MKRKQLLALICAGSIGCSFGCSKSEGTKQASTSAARSSTSEAGEQHEHMHGAGPNGGVVFDLGSHHAEFTVDHGKHQAMVVVLGADEKTLTPIDTKELVLVTKETKTAEGKVVPPMTIAMQQSDAAGGKTSKFVGTDEGLGNVAEYSGTISGEIEGKPAMGEFAEK